MKYVVFYLFVVYIVCERKYSNVSFDDPLIRSTGIHFAKFENVCIEVSPSIMFVHILYFINSIGNIKFLTNYLLNHRFGEVTDSLVFIVGKYPQLNVYDDDIWVSRGCCRSISHFMDFVSFWIINQNHSLYPTLSSIIFTQFQPNTFYDYHTLLNKLFIPKHVKVKFYYDLNKLLRKKKIICFKKVYYMIRSENGNYGMIYRNIETRKQFRDHCYKYMNLKYNKINQINSLFIYRNIKVARRLLLNQKDVLNVMASMGLDVKATYFDGKSVKEQIDLIRDVNLIINVYGSSITNLLWLSSNIAFVIELTGVYVFNDFQRYTTVNGYNYIPLFTTKNFIDHNKIYKNFKFEEYPCFHQSIQYYHPLKETSGDSITISLNQLRNGVYYGINYLKYLLSYKNKTNHTQK